MLMMVMAVVMITMTIGMASASLLTLDAPADIKIEGTGITTPVVLGTETVTGGIPPYVTGNNAPAGGFVLGETVVTWKTQDSVLATALDSQKVTIVDTTAPIIVAPADIITPATGILTYVNLGFPIGGDLVDPTPTVTNDAPATSNFRVGTTIVTWKVCDHSGNCNTDTQSVTINNAQTNGGTVQGKVFNDLDKDKKLDQGEPGIIGVAVKLTGDDKKTKKIKLKVKTDANGNYIFQGLINGKYELYVEIKHGWEHTTSTSYKITIKNGNVVIQNFGEKPDKKHH
jgi:hypothetical protein